MLIYQRLCYCISPLNSRTVILRCRKCSSMKIWAALNWSKGPHILHLVHICHLSSVSHVFFSSYVQAERDVIEKIFIKQVDLKQMKTYNNFLDIHSKKKKSQKLFVRSGIRTHAHIRGPESSLLRSEEFTSWVWRLRPLGHPDIDSLCNRYLVYVCCV